MQKAILATMVIGSVLLTGCGGNKFDGKPQGMPEVTDTTHVFEHELFSLELSAEFVAESNSIQPQNEQDFPLISFNVAKSELQESELLESISTREQNLCEQTDACAKITANEWVKIAGKDALKFTTETAGRNLGDSSGHTNSYNYAILNDGNLFEFSTSTTDAEAQDVVSEKVMAFDGIMESLTFSLSEGDNSLAAKYGEKTRKSTGAPIEFTGEEIGSGQMFNDDKNKAIDKWYFINEEGKTAGSSQKQLLNIDDQCHIHAVGFTNGSCIKYLSLEENKQVTYDGYNGPSILIYGETLPDQSIHVTDMVIQQ